MTIDPRLRSYDSLSFGRSKTLWTVISRNEKSPIGYSFTSWFVYPNKTLAFLKSPTAAMAAVGAITILLDTFRRTAPNVPPFGKAVAIPRPSTGASSDAIVVSSAASAPEVLPPTARARPTPRTAITAVVPSAGTQLLLASENRLSVAPVRLTTNSYAVPSRCLVLLPSQAGVA